jgi:hypothetical protein
VTVFLCKELWKKKQHKSYILISICTEGDVKISQKEMNDVQIVHVPHLLLSQNSWFCPYTFWKSVQKSYFFSENVLVFALVFASNPHIKQKWMDGWGHKMRPIYEGELGKCGGGSGGGRGGGGISIDGTHPQFPSCCLQVGTLVHLPSVSCVYEAVGAGGHPPSLNLLA